MYIDTENAYICTIWISTYHMKKKFTNIIVLVFVAYVSNFDVTTLLPNTGTIENSELCYELKLISLNLNIVNHRFRGEQYGIRDSGLS